MADDSVNVDDASTSSAGAHRDLTEAMENSSHTNEQVTETMYNIVPDPKAENVDLSKLRGVASNDKKKKEDLPADTDLENLAELVPDVKARRKDSVEHASNEKSNNVIHEGEDAVEVVNAEEQKKQEVAEKRYSMFTTKSDNLNRVDSMQVQKDSGDLEQKSKSAAHKKPAVDYRGVIDDEASSGNNADGDTTSYDNAGSDQALEDVQDHHSDSKIPKEFMNVGFRRHNPFPRQHKHTEVRMPMYLPTFKPATGCTNASDFIVRCFVARLRSGITVVKHGRSRWCKSRLRVLHIHPDGRSLSWKPAEGEPTSSQATTKTRFEHLSRSPTRLEPRSAKPHVHGHPHSPAKVRSSQCSQVLCTYFQTTHR